MQGPAVEPGLRFLRPSLQEGRGEQGLAPDCSGGNQLKGPRILPRHTHTLAAVHRSTIPDKVRKQLNPGLMRKRTYSKRTTNLGCQA